MIDTAYKEPGTSGTPGTTPIPSAFLPCQVCFNPGTPGTKEYFWDFPGLLVRGCATRRWGRLKMGQLIIFQNIRLQSYRVGRTIGLRTISQARAPYRRLLVGTSQPWATRVSADLIALSRFRMDGGPQMRISRSVIVGWRHLGSQSSNS